MHAYFMTLLWHYINYYNSYVYSTICHCAYMYCGDGDPYASKTFMLRKAEINYYIHATMM